MQLGNLEFVLVGELQNLDVLAYVLVTLHTPMKYLNPLLDAKFMAKTICSTILEKMERR